MTRHLLCLFELSFICMVAVMYSVTYTCTQDIFKSVGTANILNDQSLPCQLRQSPWFCPRMHCAQGLKFRPVSEV